MQRIPLIHTTKQHFPFLTGLIVFLVMVFNQPSAANETFIRVNCNQISQISNSRLFFVSSEHGFVHDLKTGSPLQEEIPAEISGSKYQNTQSVDTVLVQVIKTNQQDFKTLEGGLPGGQWVWIIAGGVLGVFIARFFRQEQIFGAIVGVIAVMLIGSLLFESDDFRLYVDNATDQNILLTVDSFPPVSISSRSQIGVKFKEGTHFLKTMKASDKSVLEDFSFQAMKYKDSSGDAVDGYYIYNVAAKNNYSIHHVVYAPK